MLRAILGLVLALSAGLAPARASAELYRWVDEQGVTHYTTDLDSIPRSARDRAWEIPASPEAVSAPAPARTAPVEAAPAVEPPVVETRDAETLPVEALPVATPRLETPEVEAPLLETPPVEAAPPALVPATELAPALDALGGETPEPAGESAVDAPDAPTVFPGPPATPALPEGDPRAAEVAALEAQIAADRERLRQMISTKRWDSAELASDPEIREIAERLPRLQAELAALRAETVQ